MATRFLANLDAVTLPEDSYYMSVKDVIQHQSEDVPFAESTETYAQSVVRSVENGASGKIWVGGAAWMSRVLMSWVPLPDGFFVSIIFLICGFQC